MHRCAQTGQWTHTHTRTRTNTQTHTHAHSSLYSISFSAERWVVHGIYGWNEINGVKYLTMTHSCISPHTESLNIVVSASFPHIITEEKNVHQINTAAKIRRLKPLLGCNTEPETGCGLLSEWCRRETSACTSSLTDQPHTETKSRISDTSSCFRHWNM